METSIILLYLGPETIMPLGSFLAAGVGIILVFWRQATLLFRRSFRRILGRKGGYPGSGRDLEGEGTEPGQRPTEAD